MCNVVHYVLILQLYSMLYTVLCYCAASNGLLRVNKVLHFTWNTLYDAAWSAGLLCMVNIIKLHLHVFILFSSILFRPGNIFCINCMDHMGLMEFENGKHDI